MINLIPSGYGAQLLGSSINLVELDSVVRPLEEAKVEGTMMLMRVSLSELPSAEVLAQLVDELVAAGVTPWPGYSLTYVDIEEPGIYVTWVKGLAWTPIIIGILIVTLLPLIIGGIIWALLPESIKQMINMMIMMVVVVMMMKMMTPMLKGASE